MLLPLRGLIAYLLAPSTTLAAVTGSVSGYGSVAYAQLALEQCASDAAKPLEQSQPASLLLYYVKAVQEETEQHRSNTRCLLRGCF